MKTCLIISYVFPPTGGAGVQRVLKFVKYLGACGWKPVVVTPRRPSAPVQDHSFDAELPPGLAVHRLPTLEPGLAANSGGGAGAPSGLKAALRRLAGGLLFPDRHVIWLATALPGTLAAARRHGARAVLVSAPPFSSFLLGRAAARLLGLPLVLDFRDDWSGFFTRGFTARGGGGAWRSMALGLEGSLVRAADRVIGNTPAMNRRLQRLHGGPAEKFVWIPNGFDPEDFSFLQDAPPPAPAEGRLNLLYTGTVFDSTSLEFLWQGLELLPVDQRRRLAVEIVGRAAPGHVLYPGLEGLKVVARPYEPHARVLRRMASAGALLLTLSDIPGLERVVPAKLYEYLAARRPILAVAPRGEATKIVEACGAGRVAPPGRPQLIAETLLNWLDDPPPRPGPPPKLFDRRRQTALLARVLDQAAGLERVS